MFLKVRRLFCKPFSSKVNLFTVSILVFILYVSFRSFLLNNTIVINPQNGNQQVNPNEQNANNNNNPSKSVNNQNNNNNNNNNNRNYKNSLLITCFIEFLSTVITFIANQKVDQFSGLLRIKGIIDDECKIDSICSDDTFPYLVTSGSGYDNYPKICFDGKLLLSKTTTVKAGRGINFVKIKIANGTYFVDKIHVFDTFTEDGAYFRYLKTDTSDGDIIILASYDEMTIGLRDITHSFMEYFGSEKFRSIKFRDSFVMIGQRGIAKGKAVEMWTSKGKSDFAAASKITGCLKIPIAPIVPLPAENIQINARERIAVGEIVKYCGLPEPCPSNEFPVHVFSGLSDKDGPRICVDGKYVLGKDLNDGGRGLNLVVIGNGKEIIKTAHFDTYTDDSTNLEIFLENLYDNVIVIIVTFDEASTKLGPLAKNLLYDLGSALIQNLKHRDAWYLIGQKGINGFSPIEEISYTLPDSPFPVPLDKRMCVPLTIKGMKIRPDPLPAPNQKRRDFCGRFDGYGDFCFDENIDQQLKPAPIINKTLEDHPIYKTPILVIAGLSHNSLRMSLETIIMQPGIKSNKVFVALDEKLEESGSLIELFGFNLIKTKSSTRYMEQYEKALENIWYESTEKDKDAIIVIEEELLLSPDFLYFLTQVYDSFMKDDDLAAVSTWNPNGYSELDGCPHMIYRSNDFPGFGYLLKKSVYEKYMRNKFSECCNSRAWTNWNLKNDKLSVLVPDVSRVFHRPYNGLDKENKYLESLFNRDRKTNLLPFPDIEDLSSIANEASYDQFIKNKLKIAIEFPNIDNCYKNGVIEFPTMKHAYFKIVYEQEKKDDYTNLKRLCKCFFLFYDETHNPKSLYKGVLRFHAIRNNYILIGSKSDLLA